MIESYFSLFWAIVILTLKPGPGMALIVIRSLSDGFKGGYAVAWGYITVEIGFFLVVAFAYSLFQEYADIIAAITKSAGGAYLIYLGVKSFQKMEFGRKLQPRDTKQTLWENYTAGIALNIANPITIFLYAAILPTVFDMTALSTEHVLLGLATMIIANAIMLAGEAGFGKALGRLLRSKDTFMYINISAALCFIILGLVIAWSAFPYFDFEGMYF